MRIGIDARFVGPKGTGLGVYTQNLIENLQKIDRKNHYSIFLKEDNWSHLKLTNPKFKKVLADIPWYSLAEQTKMYAILNANNLDLVHFPHFNIPFFYKGKFVVTIHDLVHKHFPHTSTSTKNPFIFKLKRFGFNKILNHAINDSAKIIAPSNFVKEDILDNFNVPSSKITVTYEAAEKEYFSNRQSSIVDRQLTLLYVGNAYPHKNLEKLLDALKILNTKYNILDTNLTLVCPRDVFSQRLKHLISQKGLQDKVMLTGYKKPRELSAIFARSTAYISPSLSEGFGIPGLNAMASQILLICSNIPTFKEIYGDAAVYFDPNDSSDIANKIKRVLSDEKLRDDLIKKGLDQVRKYSWLKMAQQTLKVYEEASK